MLLFLDHILYHRAHFVRDALCALRAMLAINNVLNLILTNPIAHVVAIQETKINSTITTAELFQETCMYSEYRKDSKTSVTCQSWNWKITLCLNQFGYSQTNLLLCS